MKSKLPIKCVRCQQTVDPEDPCWHPDIDLYTNKRGIRAYEKGTLRRLWAIRPEGYRRTHVS